MILESITEPVAIFADVTELSATPEVAPAVATAMAAIIA